MLFKFNFEVFIGKSVLEMIILKIQIKVLETVYILSHIMCCLTFTTLWADSADVDDIFLTFPRKIGFGISCKLSPEETICMKCQNLFLGKIRKIFQNVC